MSVINEIKKKKLADINRETIDDVKVKDIYKNMIDKIDNDEEKNVNSSDLSVLHGYQRGNIVKNINSKTQRKEALKKAKELVSDPLLTKSGMLARVQLHLEDAFGHYRTTEGNPINVIEYSTVLDELSKDEEITIRWKISKKKRDTED